jgi:hypothetical protein
MTRKIAGAVTIGWIVILSAASLNAQRAAGRVSVIVGQNAPALERFAASELCGYLNKLFDLQTQPTIALDASSSAVFLIGSPATNGADQVISEGQRPRDRDPSRGWSHPPP